MNIDFCPVICQAARSGITEKTLTIEYYFMCLITALFTLKNIVIIIV